MDTEPKITIVVPVFKVERYLPQCLDSIMNQTYQNLEIIVIDDGSPDRCGEICDEYAEKDDRVTVIHKENGGVNTARNIGIQMATGEWIALMDSDDWCESDYIENMVKSAEESKADIFYAGGFYIDYPEKSIKVQTFEEPFHASGEEEIESLRQRVLLPKQNNSVVAYGYPWDKLYRTSFMHGFHLLYDDSLKAWDDMWSNFKIFGRARMISGGPAIGYHYRQVEDSITKGYNPQKPSIMYHTISAFHDYADHNGLTGDLKEAITEAAIPAIAAGLNCYYFHPENHMTRKEANEKVQEMLNWPYYHEAIHSKGNRYLTTRQLALKYALRFGKGGVLRMLFTARRKLRNPTR